MQVDFQGSAHFKRSELMCHCGCGQALIDPRLVDALEQLRSTVGIVIVNDAYRCPEHNAAVKGVKASTHLLGQAADIVLPMMNVQRMYDEAKLVKSFSAGGIGAYSGEDGSTPRLHVDVREDGPARWGVKYGERQVDISEVVKP